MPQQGDIYWFDHGLPRGSEPAYRRPGIVIQNDQWNESGLRTVIMMWVTSNLRLASFPGNVLLHAGEGGLPRACVAVAHQVSTLDIEDLGGYIGHLSVHRVRAVVAGLRRVTEPPSAR